MLNNKIKKKQLIFKLFFLTISSIPRIIIIYIQNFKKILFEDSFYAESLRLFYLRLYKVAIGRDLYIKNISSIISEGFLYQSFGAIIICYKIFGRSLYILLCNIIFIFYLFIFFTTKDALIISSLYIFSSVFYFNQIERGNYSFLGLIISLIALNYYFINGLNIEFLLLYFLSIFFSISSFVILSLLIGIELLINYKINNFFSIFSYGLFILCFFIFFNIIFLKLNNNKFRLKNFFKGIELIFLSIGLLRKSYKEKKSINIIKRKITLFRGFISILPFLIAGIIDKNFISPIFILLILIIYLNQSKILRIFDYYFIYTWSFCYLLTTLNSSSFTEILGLIIIGTNPIYIYAMDNYNFNMERGFKIEPPIFLSKKDRSKLLKRISNILPKGDTIIFPINKNIKDYNDLWRNESLLLEWIWTALENSKNKFFPDWFSIFHVSKLKYNFNNLENLGKITNAKKLSFEKVVKNKKNKKIKMYKLNKIFNDELLERYCPKIRKYFLLIR